MSLSAILPSITFEMIGERLVALFAFVSIDQSFPLPCLPKLKVQFMKVVPDDFIAGMKASIDVVGWSISLSLVEVSFSEMASVVALIFIEVPVRMGMPLLLASFTPPGIINLAEP